ncbi:MAG: NAD(P)-dependent oxidoreductase [Legionellales bacterium]|nr:NAD(P)-dependent oxidoreductase [Legionellales bacterium]
MDNLKDKVIFITGATRGIGRAIALHAAKDGAIIAVTGKTDKPHPILPGTIFSVAEEIEQAGGTAIPLVLDVRDEKQIQTAVDQVGRQFGRIDVLINNASAIQLTSTPNTPLRKFDLLFAVNVRATFAVGQACIPYLEKAVNPHILTLSPPLNLDPKWFGHHLAYTMSKYGMSMCTLGWAEELRDRGIAANSLWPRTTIATMAIKAHFPEAVWQASRHPEIMADAAHWILTQNSRHVTGHFFIDEDALKQAGISDFSAYAVNPEAPLMEDLFLS